MATYDQVWLRLPTDGAPFTGHDHIFDFPDHTMRTPDGEFPIESIKIKYSVKITAKKIQSDGENFAKAIIKGVLIGAYTFIWHDGKITQPDLPSSPAPA